MAQDIVGRTKRTTSIDSEIGLVTRRKDISLLHPGSNPATGRRRTLTTEKKTKDDGTKPNASRYRNWVLVLLCACAFSTLWVVVTTFAPIPVGILRPDGWLCPRRTVCAEDWWSMFLLAISRVSAYFCYPLIMLLFLTKTNNLRTLLIRTPVAMFVPLQDTHQMHIFCGKVVAWGIFVHAICHLLRWGLQGQVYLLWGHVTGRSGALSLLLTPLIIWPMLWPSLKKIISWEWRKGLHYLSIIWGISIMFHAPQMRICWLIGIPVFLYIGDLIYGFFARTYLIDASQFTRLECGVELQFSNPKGYESNVTGYIMLCIPWISKWEWHAFSVFAHPSKPGHSCVCIASNGDWTRELHDEVNAPTTRPVFIAGPFASPYSTALKYDNVVLVASGVGITPALGIINTHKATKRVNLIWSCREPSLVEFYLKNTHFDEDAWTLIYYTGKRRLLINFALPKTVLIFAGRPDLESVVLQIVAGIELGTGLPGTVLDKAEQQKEAMRELASELMFDGLGQASPIDKFSALLKRCMTAYSVQELHTIIATRTSKDEHGFMSAEFDIHAVLDELMPDAFTDIEARELVLHFDENGDGDVCIKEFRTACYTIFSSMTDEDHHLSRCLSSTDELESASLAEKMMASFHPESNHATGSFRITDSTTAAQLHKDYFDNWTMLYCGGSQPVVDTLTNISQKTGLTFRSEKFDW